LSDEPLAPLLDFLKSQAKNYTLLYAEDETLIQNELGEIFRKLFKSTLFAEDGKAALDLYEKHKPDLVVTDLLMPKIDGKELVEAIHKLNPDQSITVISAHSEGERLIELINLGISSFVLKPASLHDLLKALTKEILILSARKESVYREKHLHQGLIQERAELLEAKAILDDWKKTRKNLVSLLSHELRTPLNGLRGFFDLIKEKLPQDVQTQEHLELMEKAFSRLENVAAKAIRISHLATTGAHSKNVEFDLKSFFLEYIQTHTPEAHIRILSEKSIHLLCDPNLLTEVVDNVVDNALKYSGQDRLDIDYDWEDLHVKITFRDYGPGLGERELKEMDLPFNSREILSHKEGMGLGLSLSKNIMELLEGELLLSNHPQGGLVVELRLYPFDIEESSNSKDFFPGPRA